MEISVVRRRLTETIERAKKQAADRRSRGDQAARDFEVFLQKIAVPLFRQIANALKADGYAFTVFTPSGSVRLMSDRAAQDYIELTLDAAENPPQIVGQISRARGGRVIDSERPIGAPDALTEEQLLDFLLKELEAFVER
jgi:hypothetical protein